MTPVELPTVHPAMPVPPTRRVEAHEQRQEQRRRQPAQTASPAAASAGHETEHVDIHV